jgi:hypothetical protein
MIPYYSCHSCKMFIQSKPIRFGFKQRMLCLSTKYPFHMEVYMGKTGSSKDATVPLGSKVGREMLKCVTHDVMYCVWTTLSHQIAGDDAN